MNKYEKALQEHKSERKAAKSLGLTRGKFMGSLKKHRGLCFTTSCKNPPEPSRTRCRPCLIKCATKKSKEEIKEKNRAYYAANRELLASNNRAYQKKNLDKFNKSRKKYDKTPKGRVSAAKRRARRNSYSDETMSSSDYALLKEKMPHCFNCESPEDLTLDHHIPISKGGTLVLGNTVVLCRSCNSSKQDRDPSEFYTSTKLDLLKSILKEF